MEGFFIIRVVSQGVTRYHSNLVSPDHGELYTWGKAGPHLGYEVKSTKQTSPRLVEFAKGQVKVMQVSCGVSHTLGMSAGHVTWLGSCDCLIVQCVWREGRSIPLAPTDSESSAWCTLLHPP